MDVTHVAKLANLPLTPQESKTYSPQLNSVLDYVSQLKQTDTSKINPTSQSIDLKNVARPDSISQKPLKLDRDYFTTSSVFDNE